MEIIEKKRLLKDLKAMITMDLQGETSMVRLMQV